MCIYKVMEGTDSLLKIITIFEPNIGLIEASVHLIPNSKKVEMSCGHQSAFYIER